MKNKIWMPLAGLGALGLALAVPGAAMASPAQSGSGSTTYQANLQPVPLNTPTGAASGHLTLQLSGDQATITEQVTGLGATLPASTKTLSGLHIPSSLAGKPFPHVQHIHGDAKGTCPTASDATNGLITVQAAAPDYGPILTTLSESGSTAASSGADVTIAPSGGSYTYSRTVTLDSTTVNAIKDGTAVIVVHGLDPATAPMSSLTTPNTVGLTLPGETQQVAAVATAPALCGALTSMPSGAPVTGGGGTAGTQNEGLFGVGGALLAGGLAVGGVAYSRRRRAHL